MFVIEVFKEQM